MNQGDVLGIVGESGSGKSVTAYSIMGLTAYPGRLVGGTVWFNGHQIDQMTEEEFRKIRGNEVLHHLPGPHDQPQPGVHHRQPDRRGHPAAHRQNQAARPTPVLGSCWSWWASTSRNGA